MSELSSTHSLTPQERCAWDNHGFVVRKRVFARHELCELREAAERAGNEAAALADAGEVYHLDGNRFVDVHGATVQFEHGQGSSAVRVIEPVHVMEPRFAALVDDARLVDPSCNLVGSAGVALWTDKLNLKRPREGSGFRWHQDSPYWIHNCNHVDKLVNVMVTLDDAKRTNGCFRIVRGSHQRGRLPGTEDGTQLGGFFTDPASFDEGDAVDLEVPAGSLIFFSAHAVHGSLPNVSDQERRAIILTYQPAGFAMLKVPRIRNAGV